MYANFFYLFGVVFFDHIMKCSCIFVNRREEGQYNKDREMFAEEKYRTAIVCYWEELDLKRKRK